MSAITTHILDLTRGLPASGVEVTLRCWRNGVWDVVAESTTDNDGRVHDWTHGGEFTPGIYQLRFESAPYFARHGTQALHPFIEIAFEVTNALHYHIPLLVTPYAYSTYRGS